MVRECSQEEATRQITDEDGTVSTLDKISLDGLLMTFTSSTRLA